VSFVKWSGDQVHDREPEYWTILDRFQMALAAILFLPFKNWTNVVTIGKADNQIQETIEKWTYLCPGFQMVFNHLFPVQFSNGLLG
jgi:hypothetical protein